MGTYSWSLLLHGSVFLPSSLTPHLVYDHIDRLCSPFPKRRDWEQDDQSIHHTLFVVHADRSFLHLWFQILKIDPKTGNVICAVKLPANEVLACTFGRCPGTKCGPVSCLYATTGLLNATQPDHLTLPSSKDGSLFRISNIGAEGPLDKNINLDNVKNLEPSCYN